MKTAKRTLIGICLCLVGTTFFGGCISWFVDPPPKFFYEYYVDEYYYIESISMDSPVTNPHFVSIDPDNFVVYSEDGHKSKYKQTSKYYGDTGYNRELDIPKKNMAYCNQFIRLDIISDTDFDDEHPAGASLGDIAQTAATSPYKYLKSGYKDVYDWKSSELYYNGPDDYSANKNGYHPVRKMLSELTPEDMLLLYPLWFKFVKEPTVKGTHRMTVILEDKEKEMTCQFDYIFE